MPRERNGDSSLKFRCERVLPVQSRHKRSFIDAYKEAFGGPPYFEKYTDQEVIEEVWEPHLRDGLVLVVCDEPNDGKMVGFGCAVPFSKAPADVRSFLNKLHEDGDLPKEFDHQSSWYMSELGVLNEYRGLGAAYELVQQRMHSMAHSGAYQYFMRTAAKGSNSRHMYLKFGASELPVLQDVSSSEQVLENDSHSHMRLYLWGDCDLASTEINRIKVENGYIPFLAPLEESPLSVTRA